MDGEVGSRLLNTNPSRFEELAGVIATAYAYYEEGRGMEKLLSDFQHLYRRALDQPPCYREINEITGQSLTSGDKIAGQTAWMLQNMETCRFTVSTPCSGTRWTGSTPLRSSIRWASPWEPLQDSPRKT